MQRRWCLSTRTKARSARRLWCKRATHNKRFNTVRHCTSRSRSCRWGMTGVWGRITQRIPGTQPQPLLVSSGNEPLQKFSMGFSRVYVLIRTPWVQWCTTEPHGIRMGTPFNFYWIFMGIIIPYEWRKTHLDLTVFSGFPLTAIGTHRYRIVSHGFTGQLLNLMGSANSTGYYGIPMGIIAPWGGEKPGKSREDFCKCSTNHNQSFSQSVITSINNQINKQIGHLSNS